MDLREQFEKETGDLWNYNTDPRLDDAINKKYVEWLEQRLEAGQHETIVMWRKPDEELPHDGQEVLFVKGNHTIKGYFSKPRSLFGPSGYNVNGVNGDHEIDKWVPISELL